MLLFYLFPFDSCGILLFLEAANCVNQVLFTILPVKTAQLGPLHLPSRFTFATLL